MAEAFSEGAIRMVIMTMFQVNERSHSATVQKGIPPFPAPNSGCCAAHLAIEKWPGVPSLPAMGLDSIQEIELAIEALTPRRRETIRWLDRRHPRLIDAHLKSDPPQERGFLAHEPMNSSPP
jgi:hypothetical protein